jgi:hypothetical protein
VPQVPLQASWLRMSVDAWAAGKRVNTPNTVDKPNVVCFIMNVFQIRLFVGDEMRIASEGRNAYKRAVLGGTRISALQKFGGYQPGSGC